MKRSTACLVSGGLACLVIGGFFCRTSDPLVDRQTLPGGRSSSPAASGESALVGTAEPVTRGSDVRESGRIRLLDKWDGQPVVGHLLRLRSSLETSVLLRSGDEGLVDLPIGDWRFVGSPDEVLSPMDVRIEASSVVDVWLTTVGQVELLVVDEARVPVAAACAEAVADDRAEEPVRHTTGPDGRLVLRCRRDDTSSITVSKRGHVPVRVAPAWEGTECRMTVVLPRDPFAQFTLVCCDGREGLVQGVSVSASPRGQGPMTWLGTSDAYGRVEMPGWAACARELRFGGTAFPSRIQSASLHPSPTGECRVKVPRRVRGSFFFSPVRPSGSLSWEIGQEEVAPSESAVNLQALSVSDGWDRLEAELPLDVRVVVAFSSSSGEQWRGRVEVHEESWQHVIDIGEGARLATCDITLRCSNARLSSVRLAAGAGEAAVASLEHLGASSTAHVTVIRGEIALRLEAETGAVATIVGNATDAQAAIDVAFHSVGRLAVHCVGTDALPVSDVFVEFRSATATQPLRMSNGHWNVLGGNQSGRVTLDGRGQGHVLLAIGTYNVFATHLHSRGGGIIPCDPRSLTLYGPDQQTTLTCGRPRLLVVEAGVGFLGLSSSWTLTDGVASEVSCSTAAALWITDAMRSIRVESAEGRTEQIAVPVGRGVFRASIP